MLEIMKLKFQILVAYLVLVCPIYYAEILRVDPVEKQSLPPPTSFPQNNLACKKRAGKDSSILLTSHYNYPTDSNVETVDDSVTWVKLGSNGERDVIVAVCGGSSCTRFPLGVSRVDIEARIQLLKSDDGAVGVDRSGSNAITAWNSTLLIHGAASDYSGVWEARWTIAGASLDQVCDFELVLPGVSMDCPSSAFVGYPTTLTSRYVSANLSKEYDFYKIHWLVTSGADKISLASCSKSNCSVVNFSKGSGYVTVSMDGMLHWQSELVLVGHTQFKNMTLTSEWYLNNGGLRLVNHCTVEIRYVDPSEDCLEPMLFLTPRFLQVTFSCLTWKIKDVVNVVMNPFPFGTHTKIVPITTVARYTIEFVRPMYTTLVLDYELHLLAENRWGENHLSSIKNQTKIQLQVESKLSLPSIDTFSVGADNMFVINHDTLYNKVEVTKSFPFPFQSNFELRLPNSDTVFYTVVVKKAFEPRQLELFEFKIQFMLTDTRTLKTTNQLMFVVQETKLPQCEPTTSFRLDLPLDGSVEFVLPCVVLDRHKSVVNIEPRPEPNNPQNAPNPLNMITYQDDTTIKIVVIPSLAVIKHRTVFVRFIISTTRTSISTWVSAIFVIRYTIPTPKFVQLVSGPYSHKFYFRVDFPTRDLQELITERIIDYLALTISRPGYRADYSNYTLNFTTTSDHNIEFEVPRLIQGTKYILETTIRVSGANITGHPFNLVTEIDPPRVRSSQPNLVAVGQHVTLNCSSAVHTKGTFSWYHSQSPLRGEDGYQLKRVASQNTSGVYTCASNDMPERLSESFKLVVAKPTEIATFTSTVTITLQRQWRQELADSKSVEYGSLSAYITAIMKKALIPHMLDWWTTSFFPGSIRVVVNIMERVLPDGTGGGAGDRLQQAIDSGLVEYFELENPEFNVHGMMWQVPEAINDDLADIILEGKPLEIYCDFSIVHSERPIFDVVWIFNGSSINQNKTKTFTFSNWTEPVEEMAQWLKLGSLKIFYYRYKLRIQKFPPRLVGKYECRVDIKTPILPPDFGDKTTSQSLTIRYFSVAGKPTVTIEPPMLVVKDPSLDVSVMCTFSNGYSVDLLNSNGDVIASGLVMQAVDNTVKFTVNPSELERVRCLVKSKYDQVWQIKSEFCRIRLTVKNDTMCTDSVDRHGLSWEAVGAGITSLKACPPTFSGVVTKKCMENGKWESSKYLNCTRTKLKSVTEEIREINNDGIRPTSDKIKEISKSVDDSVTSAEPVLSGDIVQVAAILEEVGKAVFDDGHGTELVDATSLENFANAADAVLSTNDSEWETITETEENGSVDEETSGVGQKLVIGMDKVVTSTLSTGSYSSKPIVKKKIAIKRDKLGLKDINFPDEFEEDYKTNGQWVITSGNKAFLSAKNFKNTLQNISYAIVLYNGMRKKMVVDPVEQKKYNETRELIGKEVASKITSFSLSSKSISMFTLPLTLKFPIEGGDGTDPVCGYLDTTLGNRPVWSTQGCWTKVIGPDVVECQCDHLTNFAILMSPVGTSDEHHDILTIVTYVGCGISIICLVVTIILHVITWKYVKDDRTVLHVHLCVVLVCAYVTFIAGVDQTDVDTICTTIAALLHFLFLAVFFIMLAEGILMYLTITHVFSKKSHLWKLLCMSYICPLAIVGACLGITQVTGRYTSPRFCWLNVDSGILWGFVGPALFVIFINFIILLVTLNRMATSIAMKEKDAKTKMKSSIRAIFILCPIFGLTWVFGVFSVNESLVVFQYIFAAFNAFQGLFIFFIYGALSRHIKDGFKNLRRKHRARSFASEERPYDSSSHPHKKSESVSTTDRTSGLTNSTRFSDMTTSTSTRHGSLSEGQNDVTMSPNTRPTRETKSVNIRHGGGGGGGGVHGNDNMSVMNPAFIND